MKVTTVRFSEDLWDTVTAEAEMAGVSASQFIREAALARAAAAAGARGEIVFDAFPAEVDEAARADLVAADAQRTNEPSIAAVTRAAAANTRSDAQALRAESKQAMRLSAKLREERSSERPPKRST